MWPEFRWDSDRILASLAAVRHRQGRMFGKMESLGFELREEAMLQTLTEDVTKSSEIEGEYLDKGQVTLVRNSELDRSRACGGAQVMRCDTGMPRRVMMLMTLQPAAASAFCVGRVRAWRRRPITVL